MTIPSMIPDGNDAAAAAAAAAAAGSSSCKSEKAIILVKLTFLFDVQCRKLRPLWGSNSQALPCWDLNQWGSYGKEGGINFRCFSKQLATAAMPAVAKMIDC